MAISRAAGRRRRGFSGVNRLRRKLRRMPEWITETVRREIAATAQAIHFNQLALLAQNTTARTGTLAKSLDWKTARDGLTARIGIIGKLAQKAAFYARFIEFGTVKMPARPFIHPAFEMERKRASARIARAISATLRRAMRGPSR